MRHAVGSFLSYRAVGGIRSDNLGGVQSATTTTRVGLGCGRGDQPSEGDDDGGELHSGVN